MRLIPLAHHPAQQVEADGAEGERLIDVVALGHEVSIRAGNGAGSALTPRAVWTTSGDLRPSRSRVRRPPPC